jgi:predicted acetyltransferase
MQLVRPLRMHLASYVAALERGWSADNVRGEAAAREELDCIRSDPAAFIASLDDPQGKGPPITLPDGSRVPRLPGYQRWMWDGEFAGSIGFRWQYGTVELPSYCLGHIGYAVVPWKQRRGYATAALRDLLQEAARTGLPYVELITDPDNIASQRVIEAAGGTLYQRFTKPPQYGGQIGLRYRIVLPR